MLSDNIIVKDQANVDHTFVKVSNTDPNTSRRLDAARTDISQPRELTIQGRAITRKGQPTADRKTIQIKTTTLNSAGQPEYLPVGVYFEKNRTTTHTESEVVDSIAMLRDLLDDPALVGRIMRGEF